MRKLLAMLALVASVLTLSACGYTPTANDREANQQEASDAQQAINQPTPAFNFSQWRQNLIEIETAEAKGVQTTSFIMGTQVNPDPIMVCPSVGVPLPISASLTNPEQLDSRYINQGGGTGGNWVSGTVGQKDPNGVYMGTGAGTFVICIGADGAALPVYAEGDVHTVFGPAVWDYTKHAIKITGPASFRFTTAKEK